MQPPLCRILAGPLQPPSLNLAEFGAPACMLHDTSFSSSNVFCCFFVAIQIEVDFSIIILIVALL